MPFYIITGAYAQPHRGEGTVEPYGWHGKAKNTKAAVRCMQAVCCFENEWDMKAGDPIEVIDIWELHPADVIRFTGYKDPYLRMRPRPLP